MPNSAGKQHFFEIDDVFANYTIVHFCGRGAYGEVYLAEDITHKTVALKIIPISSGSEVWRMELIGLRHYRQAIEDNSCLIEVMHVGETENYFYYTMEAADNMLHGDSDEYIADTLAHRLERGGRLEPEKVLELANTLLTALENLADHDLAHRDIKPANIVFINGQAKLSDIGLISNTGVRSKVVGTLEFLPPELVDGDPVGYGHDLYSLGKVLYCALTGLLPDNFPEVPVTVPLRAWRQFKNAILKACSPDPRNRFYTPADFRAALPSAIKETTFLDEGFECLRQFRKQHPITWRLCSISSSLIAVALLTSLILTLQQQRQQQHVNEDRINFIYRTIDMLNDRQLQLQRLAFESGNIARPRQLQVIAELAANARAEEDWTTTERYCMSADALLRLWSNEEFRLLTKKYPTESLPATTPELMKILEGYSRFTSTALLDYLHADNQEKLWNTIARIRLRLLDQWSGPLPGSNWYDEEDPDMSFVYIQGSPLPGEPRNSFWIGVNEITNQTARSILKKNGLQIPDNSWPVINLSWNDRIDICREITEKKQASGTLPPGYIYRLPYSEEWTFVMHGAWESAGLFLHEQQAIKDYAWYGGNSQYQLHQVRTLSSGTPGVYDLIGNASESVMISPPPPGDIPHTGNFGGSFRDRKISKKLQQICTPDMLTNNWSGMRMVLGRGAMDYFSQNWYNGAVYRTLLNGVYYETLGSPDCSWSGDEAQAWCSLLGVKPAILHDLQLRKKLYNKSLRLQSLPTMVGAVFDSKSWIWHDNTPVNNGEWLNGKPENTAESLPEYLIWDHDFWRSLPREKKVPQILIEYPQQYRFSGNWEDTVSPLILQKLSIGNRKFWIMQASVDWYTAKRLAQMLGGELAVFDNINEQQKILRQTDEFSDLRLAVGGFRKNGQWLWLNNKFLSTPLKVERIDHTRSFNSCFITLYNKQICVSDQFDGFICEIK